LNRQGSTVGACAVTDPAGYYRGLSGPASR